MNKRWDGVCVFFGRLCRRVIGGYNTPITDHRSPITDHHRSPITDHRSPITDHRSPITDHRSPGRLAPEPSAVSRSSSFSLSSSPSSSSLSSSVVSPVPRLLRVGRAVLACGLVLAGLGVSSGAWAQVRVGLTNPTNVFGELAPPQNIAIRVHPTHSTAITIDLTCSGGTATKTTDYTCAGSVTIPANTSYHEFQPFTFVADSEVEGSEMFTLTLDWATAMPNVVDGIHPSSYQGGRFSNESAIMTLHDTPIASFKLPTSTASEEDGTHQVRVTFSQPVSGSTPLIVLMSGSATIELACGDTDAVADANWDYSINRFAGDTARCGERAINLSTRKTLTLTINDDTRVEGTETIVLRLATVDITGYMVTGAKAVHTVTLTDNDVPPRARRPSRPSPPPPEEAEVIKQTVQTTVQLTVETPEVDEGAPITVKATLGEAQDTALHIPLTVVGGTAESGKLMTPLPSVIIRAREKEGVVQLMTTRDADRADETVRIALDTAALPPGLEAVSSSEVTVMIRDSEQLRTVAAPWLSRWARGEAGVLVDGIADRLSHPLPTGGSVTLAGRTMTLAPTERENHRENKGRWSWTPDTVAGRAALAGSALTLSGSPDADGRVRSVWARGGWSRFDGEAGTLLLDGESVSAIGGVEQAHGRGRLGLALSHHVGEGDYRRAAGHGALESSVTLLAPYGSVHPNERTTLWGTMGAGTGELTVTPDGEAAQAADIDLRLVGAGGRHTVRAGLTGPTVTLVSDGRWVQVTSDRSGDGTVLDATHSEMTRWRGGVESRWHRMLDSGVEWVPRLTVSARHDGGDAERGWGLDLGGAVDWRDPARSLSVTLSGRAVATHESDELREQGLSATLHWDPTAHSRVGPSLSLHHHGGGAAADGLERAWAGAYGEDTGSVYHGVTLSWGFVVGDGGRVGSPFAEWRGSGSVHSLRLGWRLERAATHRHDRSLTLGVTRRERDGEVPRHGIGLALDLRW